MFFEKSSESTWPSPDFGDKGVAKEKRHKQGTLCGFCQSLTVLGGALPPYSSVMLLVINNPVITL